MIINNGSGIDPLAAQFSQSVQPGLIPTYLSSQAPQRGTDSDPWSGENTPTADVSPNTSPATSSPSSRTGANVGKAGLGFGMGLAGVDPGIAIGVNTMYDAATGNPNTAKNALGSAVSYGTKQALGDVFGPAIGIPASIASSLATKGMQNIGQVAGTATGKTLGAMVGSVFGPIGAIAGSIVGGVATGKSMREGMLGDAFGTRSAEEMRDELEDKGYSRKEASSILGQIGLKSANPNISWDNSSLPGGGRGASGVSGAFDGSGSAYGKDAAQSYSEKGAGLGGWGTPSNVNKDGSLDVGGILGDAGWGRSSLGTAIGDSFGSNEGGMGGMGAGGGMAGGPDGGYGAEGSAYA